MDQGGRFQMMIKKFSKQYSVKQADDTQYPQIYELCKSNTKYYDYIRTTVSMEDIKEDLMALPPNKSVEDKYFLCYYDQKTLIAIVDLIKHFPIENTAYIGLFMLSEDKQGQGIGTIIYREIEQALKSEGFNYIQLAFVKENKEAELFWKKNGFQCKGNPVQAENYVAVPMLKPLVND